MNSISTDLKEASIERLYCIDALVIRRCIFIHLIGAIGDTPTINIAFNLNMHASISRCHLCTFRRKPLSNNIPSYIDCYYHSAQRFWYRSRTRMQSLSACKFPMNDIRLEVVRTNVDLSHLFIYLFSASITHARLNRSHSDGNISPVPLYLDPYQACWIASDHLFFGLLKNTVALYGSYLPNNEARL